MSAGNVQIGSISGLWVQSLDLLRVEETSHCAPSLPSFKVEDVVYGADSG